MHHESSLSCGPCTLMFSIQSCSVFNIIFSVLLLFFTAHSLGFTHERVSSRCSKTTALGQVLTTSVEAGGACGLAAALVSTCLPTLPLLALVVLPRHSDPAPRRAPYLSRDRPHHPLFGSLSWSHSCLASLSFLCLFPSSWFTLGFQNSEKLLHYSENTTRVSTTLRDVGQEIQLISI